MKRKLYYKKLKTKSISFTHIKQFNLISPIKYGSTYLKLVATFSVKIVKNNKTIKKFNQNITKDNI